MARRNEGLLDLLVEVPWWVSVALAAGAFICLRFLVPALIPTDADLASKAILGAAPLFAWIALILFLAPTPVSAYREWRERRLLDGQKDLADIRALSWERFETLVGEAYRRQGYTVQRNSSQGADEGVDLTLKKDARVTLVQCKQWRAWKVGVKVVREIYGVMTAKHAEAAVVITSGVFTQEAKTFAHGKPIGLVDGPQLATLIRSVQKAAAGAEQHPASPTPLSSAKPIPNVICPKCGAPMVLRTAQRGSHAGQQFWGCSRFPGCRATVPLEQES